MSKIFLSALLIFSIPLVARAEDSPRPLVSDSWEMHGGIEAKIKLWDGFVSQLNPNSQDYIKRLNDYVQKNGILVETCMVGAGEPKDFPYSKNPNEFGTKLSIRVFLKSFDFSKPPINGQLQSDIVHEVDDQNKVIHSWTKPVESGIMGIDGDTLFVDFAGLPKKRVWLAIKTDGSFSIVSPKNGFDKFKKDSEYLDFQTKSVRRLKFEFPCPAPGE